MSKRSKRRQGPHRGDGEGAPPTGRAGASEGARGGRPGEGRQPDGAAAAGSSGEARRGSRAASPGGSGEARDPRRASGRGRPAPGGPSHRAASGWSLAVQLAFLVAVFAVVVLVAELAGAANLGVALGVGQIAFAIAVIYLLLRR